MIADVAFAVLATLVVFTSGLVAIARNLVHAVFWLAATLVVSAGLMVWLGAPFVAGIQIVLYTGGVITLMLFAVMLTTRAATTEIPNPVQRPGAAAIASMTLLAILLSAIWTTPELEPSVVTARSLPAIRTFDAHFVVEREVAVPLVEEAEAPAEGDEGSSGPGLEELRADAFFELREAVALAVPTDLAIEISSNEDDIDDPIVRLWLQLADPSEASRVEVRGRLDDVAVAAVELDVTAEVGRRLLTDHLLAFEALSVLLLAAMIGAIVLSRRKDP
ncbi:MAG: NADH-quinone oxidoreductase subunit J [Myxococcota bacterium]